MVSKLSEKMRFVLIGGTNTLIDFGVLFSLKLFGLPAIPANVISTTVAFLFSFFANKKFTFKTKGTNAKREFILFVVVTLFGLWVVQSVIIALLTPVFVHVTADKTVNLFITKFIASIFTIFYNYLMYSRVVFKKPSENNHPESE